MKAFREIGAVAGIVAAALLLAVEWSRLPATIPTHFGWSGAPNGYGSRIMLWVLAAVMVLLYAALSVVARFPGSFNLPVARGDAHRPGCEALGVEMVGWLKIEVVWLFVYLIWAMIRVALNDGPGVRGWFAPVVILLTLGTVAIYIGRMRRLMAEPA